MSDLAGLLGEGSPACPFCGADSCSGFPHIQPISIDTFYARPADMAKQESQPDPECDDAPEDEDCDDTRAKHGPVEDRMKVKSEDRDG